MVRKPRRTVTSGDEQAEEFDHLEGAKHSERLLWAKREVINTAFSRGRNLRVTY